MRQRSFRRSLSVCVALVASLIASAGVALGHAEREAFFPDGSGHVPEYRPLIAEPNLVVCAPDSRKRIMDISDRELRTINLKLAAKCDYRNLQDAVFDVARRGTTIYMLPGVYEETPYRAQPKCAERLAQDEEDEGAPVLTYQEQLTCPHAQNLIGIFGDNKPNDDKRECNAPVCDLQIEGTGDDPEDVIIRGGFTKDGQWMKLNGIRGDRADGLYLKNFTVELFEFNAVYILETDGFVIDEVVGRWNDEYAFLTFAVDHGLYKNCEGYNNGDSALYPGSASNVNDEDGYGQTKRWSVEIRNCKAHHNAAGYSGTAGNSVYVHDNDFYANQTGMVTDSIYPDHPGLPQDHSWVIDNNFYSNNSNYTEDYVQSGICDKKPADRGYEPKPGEPKWSGTVCPVIPAPVGAGMVIAGGNWNLLEQNRVWDNWRAGFMLISVPAIVRNEEDPSKMFDTSHFNKYTRNVMGIAPGGGADLNGVDFWWDDQGEGNCWEKNKGPDGDTTSNTMYPTGLPDCESGGSLGIPNNPYKTGSIAACALYNPRDPIFRDPPGCPFFDTPEEP